jgi:flagellar biosynthesis/type III secretory pathway chaperone
MAQMKQRLRSKGQQTVHRLGRVGSALRAAEVDALKERVDSLEAEVQECRQLNLRLAELTDVVVQLLLPVAARDEEKLEQLLARYAKGL